MAQENPIVLVHGYSDEGKSFKAWKQALVDRGYDRERIHICSYRSLTNEVSIKDIAEAFDRALRFRAGLRDDQPFDAIVHSTGMLVVRAWHAGYARRSRRLKRLIGLAPASFGSPMAHKGRSFLGAVFKGSRNAGPDFLEAGDMILDGLELGSRFTWDLAHADLLGDEATYGPGSDTPYVFTFCGNKGYGGMRKLVSEEGTDGTVRWAACALNTRKIKVNLTKHTAEQRIEAARRSSVDIPLVMVKGLNHGTILESPTKELVSLVDKALQVGSEAQFAEWKKAAAISSKAAEDTVDQWQQFVTRLQDERGDPVADYNIELLRKSPKGKWQRLEGFDLDVHAYSGDRSLRCFHVNLTDLAKRQTGALRMNLTASSGTEMVGYLGFGSDNASRSAIEVDLPAGFDDGKMKFFHPYTTTLVEITINREPLPLDRESRVLEFITGA